MSDPGMSAIVKTVACLLVVPITVFGLYVILHGHLTPGGGFPGGAVMATMIALLLVAFGKEGSKRMKRKDLLSSAESLGLLAFAAMAFIGISVTFFSNFLANTGGMFGMFMPFGPNQGYLLSGGVIPIMNIAVGLEVFAALSAIVIIMFNHRGEAEE
jgi:multisubunit Na+/H+ antiporter MnhB subunit